MNIWCLGSWTWPAHLNQYASMLHSDSKYIGVSPITQDMTEK